MVEVMVADGNDDQGGVTLPALRTNHYNFNKLQSVLCSSLSSSLRILLLLAETFTVSWPLLLLLLLRVILTLHCIARDTWDRVRDRSFLLCINDHQRGRASAADIKGRVPIINGDPKSTSLDRYLPYWYS